MAAPTPVVGDELTFNFFEHIKRTSGILEEREWQESSTITYKAYAQAGTKDEDPAWIGVMIVTAGGKQSHYVAMDGKPQCIWEKKDPDTGDVIASIVDYFDDSNIEKPPAITDFYYSNKEMPMRCVIGDTIAYAKVRGGTPPFNYELVDNAGIFALTSTGDLILANSHSGVLNDLYEPVIKVTDGNGVQAEITHPVYIVEHSYGYNMRAVRFNTDCALQIPAVENKTFSNTGLAISGYFRMFSTTGRHYIYCAGTTDATVSMAVYVEDGVVYAEHYGDDGVLWTSDPLGNVVAEAWFSLFIARVHVNSMYYCSINGVAPVTSSYTHAPAPPVATNVVYVGGREYGYGTGDWQGKSFDGLIGLFAIYGEGVPLGSMTSIEDNFNEPFTFSDPNCTAYYRMGDAPDAYATISDRLGDSDALMRGLAAGDIVDRAWFTRGYVTLNGTDECWEADFSASEIGWVDNQCTKVADFWWEDNAPLLCWYTNEDDGTHRLLLNRLRDGHRVDIYMHHAYSDDGMDGYQNYVADNQVEYVSIETYDGSKTFAGVKYYLDGVNKNLNTSRDNLTDTLIGVNSTPARLGAYYTSVWLNGWMKVYFATTDILTDTEIAQLTDILKNFENPLNVIDKSRITMMFRLYEDYDPATNELTDPINGLKMLGVNLDETNKVRK